ncbi:MAG: aspartate/tyrosine/aromatic aminotransferase [Caldilineaceae bacterium SB0661_bin_32]|uniref:Aminotransferase n=1 Tax=Caldilineaceae bacterium SB0661_bin_32 TaxID=2605255 RepID=A0A6B1D9J4_9CHLR|nr:aspartate/tyrosine/aromatic aminotransferase [Caldilineaceae bacterium SB0661_bin_32]
MFETITSAPADAILGLTEAFKEDSNPSKINLGVGVYKDGGGQTPVLAAVKEAEERLLRSEATKSYLPIDGLAAYAALSQQIVFGSEHDILSAGRAATVQTPGGTGALRVAADFVRRIFPSAAVWLSDPTWPNHPNVFGSAALQVQSYPYFEAETNGVAFDRMMAALETIPRGDVLLLHGCCHNPTGADLSPQQWQAVAAVCADRGILPLLDFAYQGFGDGLDEDATGVRIVAEHCRELLVATSYSKNFGLYNERVGALTLVAGSAEATDAANSHMKICVRTNYSNPPAHGGQIVAEILGDPELRKRWEVELAEMRNRINDMRHLFVETLDQQGAGPDFSFIARQRGMFSFSGLTPTQVQALRERHSVYIVGSGRINVAGMTESNMDYLCEALADVLK